MGKAPGADEQVFAIANRDGAGDVIVICEHASNNVPARFDALGLTAGALDAHIAWDPGALSVARGLAERLDACLVHATVSRLVYDLNRPPNAAGAMPAKSEVFDIPGNAALSPDERRARTEDFYLPFHTALHAEIARRIALGRPPAIVTIHSFTPIYFGKQRAVEFGVIHDADPALAQLVMTAAGEEPKLVARLNEPYSAADQVTHTLGLQATPYGLANVMLEIRNDLIATDADQGKWAERLARILRKAMGELQRGRHP